MTVWCAILQFWNTSQMIFVILVPYLDCIVLRFFYLVFPDCQDWWENHGGQDQGKPRGCWIFFPSPCCRWIQARVTFVINDSSGHFFTVLRAWCMLVGWEEQEDWGQGGEVQVPASQMITAAVDISGILVICGFFFVMFHFTESKRQEGQYEGKPRGLDDPIILVGSKGDLFVINNYSCSQGPGKTRDQLDK